MNKSVLLLSIFATALIVALLLQRANAGGQLRNAATEMGALTNILAEAELKLNHLERMNLSLDVNLTNRAAELVVCSNVLAQTRQRLAQSQTETRKALSELAEARAQTDRARGDGIALTQQLDVLRAELRRVGDQLRIAGDKLAFTEAERLRLVDFLAVMNSERQQQLANLNNPEFLRAQQKLLARQARAPASAQTAETPDYAFPVELLPDGSVRFIPSPTNPAADDDWREKILLNQL